MRRPSHAIQPLMGLIKSLDAKSKKTLKPIFEKLEAMRLGKVPIRTGDVDNIYGEILNHLHATYLLEVRFAAPKHRPGKLEDDEK